ncbi:MAG: hypothetical protein ACTJHU_09490 [Mycetocola sp.]
MRISTVPLAVIIAAAVLGLSGCSVPDPAVESAAPTQTPVGAEPATLDELATAVIAEGLVDSASLYTDGGSATVLTIQLGWDDQPNAQEQLAALEEITDRVDDLPADRPADTKIVLTTVRSDGDLAAVQTGYDPGVATLGRMVEIVSTPLCTTATLERRDTGDGEGERSILDLRCVVDATDPVGLAGAYDEVTALGTTIDGVDATTWQVSLAGRSTSDALLRLDAGPFPGRQDLLISTMKAATEANADRLTVIDTGTSVAISGFADESASTLCQNLVDEVTADGVERASAIMQLRDADPADWACYIRP